MNYALLDASDVVINVIVYDGDDQYSPPSGLKMMEAPDGVSIGYRRNGDGTWTAPPPSHSPQTEDGGNP